MVNTKLCTIVGAYYQPYYKDIDIIGEITEALTKIPRTTPVVLAGDLNCRIDVPRGKSRIVIEFIEKEGLTLINKTHENTYFGYNGCSTIDLVFSNRSHRKQKILTNIVARKHLPVDTTVYLGDMRTASTPLKPQHISRHMDQHRLEQIDTSQVTEHISKGNINEALDSLEGHIKDSTISVAYTHRKAKPWFNTDCYVARQNALTALHTTLHNRTEANLQAYAKARREYKTIIKKTKEDFQIKEELRQIEEAEKQPFKAIVHKQPHFRRDISMDIWERHFKNVLQAKETRPTEMNMGTPSAAELFTTEEVELTISELKNSKACGPDQIYNEHLKQTAPILVETWTSLFNECLRQGNIPQKWRHSILKILHKGKGDTNDPNTYRGIALECTPFKLMTTLLTKRLYKMTEAAIPQEQFGFQKGKCALHAVECLKADIEETLLHTGGKLHAVFIDYTKAFDLINRTILVRKIEAITGQNHYTRLIRNILKENYLEITDDVTKSLPIGQTNGVLQGDPLSPLLFVLATADIPATIATESVKMYAYADDMVLVSPSIHRLQIAFNKLAAWAEENDLVLNEEKTIMMTFKKGGKRATNDIIFYRNKPLKHAPYFKYLGITLQPRGNVFTLHVKERMANALAAMSTIRNIHRMSLISAMKLFNIKVLPVITYGLEVIWHHLTKGNLADMERVKASYMKRVMCLSKHAPSRLTYILAREPYLIEELRYRLLLPSTDAYERLHQELNAKREEIWPDFFCTDAMIFTEWMRPNYDLRHLMTRFAVHGFHHKVCVIDKYHHPDEHCMCKLCGRQCGRYHAMDCDKRPSSLTKFCEE